MMDIMVPVGSEATVYIPTKHAATIKESGFWGQVLQLNIFLTEMRVDG